MKGKWKAVLFNDNADCSYILIEDIEGVELFINTSRDVSEELQEEIHSTLNLAAAAPEMLEALKWACEHFCGDDSWWPEACKDCKIRQAINKSEGRE